MDNTSHFFKEHYILLNRIDLAEQDGYINTFADLPFVVGLLSYAERQGITLDPDATEEAIFNYLTGIEIPNAVTKCMEQAFCNSNYVLTIDHLATVLGVTNAWIEKNVLSHLDYIVPPAGTSAFWYSLVSSDFLEAEAPKIGELQMWQARYYKFKRVLINLDSFLNFMVQNLTIKFINSTNSSVELDIKLTLEQAKGLVLEQLIALPNFKPHHRSVIPIKLLYRKKDIKNLVLDLKLQKFKSSTIQDLKRYHACVTPNFLTKKQQARKANIIHNPPEVPGLSNTLDYTLVNSLTPEDLGIITHNVEVDRYVAEQQHLILNLTAGTTNTALYLFAETLPTTGALQELLDLFKVDDGETV